MFEFALLDFAVSELRSENPHIARHYIFRRVFTQVKGCEMRIATFNLGAFFVAHIVSEQTALHYIWQDRPETITLAPRAKGWFI